MKSFYVTLVSGSSQHLYPNTASKFTNNLVSPLALEEGVEFGICEISYIRNMNNIDITDGWAGSVFDHLYENNIQSNGVKSTMYGKYFPLKIKSGIYESHEEICDCMNAIIQLNIPRLKNIKVFSYDKTIRRYKINAKKYYLTISVRKDFSRIIGAGDRPIRIGLSKNGGSYKYGGKVRKYLDSTKTWIARSDGVRKYAGDLKRIDTFLIYSNLVSEQYTGDTFSNLLRMCPVHGKDNQRVVE